MLRCIRCGACINHCPIYGAVGGHAYGWVYSGPMGAVLIPNLLGVDEAGHLPNASTLCGRCEEVCPMHIPLPRLLRRLRDQQFEAGKAPRSLRWGLKGWAILARRPWLYEAVMNLGVGAMAAIGRGKGRLKSLPLARGWTSSRDLPVPAGRTFQRQWAAQQKARS
jgi:L-lactate dehydrogenase complex protein LldF